MTPGNGEGQKTIIHYKYASDIGAIQKSGLNSKQGQNMLPGGSDLLSRFQGMIRYDKDLKYRMKIRLNKKTYPRETFAQMYQDVKPFTGKYIGYCKIFMEKNYRFS